MDGWIGQWLLTWIELQLTSWLWSTALGTLGLAVIAGFVALNYVVGHKNPQ